jgi:hypothetical protein
MDIKIFNINLLTLIKSVILFFVIKVNIIGILFLFFTLSLKSQPVNPFGNPLIPDMAADASIQEIDGILYYYATTDGYDRGLETSGPPVVWKSKDFNMA